MKDLIFATQNPNKVQEVLSKLDSGFNIKTLAEVGIHEELPETADSLEGNALQKARNVYSQTKQNCFADDTGLEVEALNNEPGVYSARYAGPDKSAADNINKVLRKLQGQSNRNASFKTVLALIYDGKEYVFEGKVEGEIVNTERGGNGFGYDPIFRAKGHDKTFAEMDRDEKNKISHRAITVNKLVDFLNSI